MPPPGSARATLSLKGSQRDVWNWILLGKSLCKISWSKLADKLLCLLTHWLEAKAEP